MAYRNDFDVRLRSINYVVVAADCSSFAEAAEHLNENVDTVRRGVAEVEEWLSRRLFNRPGRLTLTNEGRRFLPVAREICDLAGHVKSSQTIKQTMNVISSFSEAAYAHSLGEAKMTPQK